MVIVDELLVTCDTVGEERVGWWGELVCIGEELAWLEVLSSS